MLAEILMRVHNFLGVWALALFLFLISESLSTVGQRVFFPWPKIEVKLDFPRPRGAQAGPGRPPGGPGRPREAS